MNIHHLELFCYVAKQRGHCGGRAQHAIWNSAAGRKRTNRQTRRSSWHEIIQSKTVLAPSGWRRVVRVGQTVLHDYVPELLRRVRRRFPIFRLQLHEAARADAERLLQAGEIDVAITIIDSKRRPEIHSRPLLELPLILLVNKKHHLTTAKQLWSRDKIEETLITFHAAMHYRPISSAEPRPVRRRIASGHRSQFDALNRGLRCERLSDRSDCGYPRFQTSAASARDIITKLSTGHCRSSLGRKTVAIAQQFLAEVEIEATAMKRNSRLG